MTDSTYFGIIMTGGRIGEDLQPVVEVSFALVLIPILML